MRYNYLFGPLHSRRLGLSLGINLFTEKTCSLNCVYCECGPSATTTVERREYVPTADVLAEIDHFFASNETHPDSLTFSGLGEPTLHSGIGGIITHVKNRYPSQRVTLLTNATLFYDPAVRQEVLGCDMIVPSVDALSPAVFAKMYGKPHPSLDPECFKRGLLALKQEYRGELVVELFVIGGLNDTESELTLLRDFFRQLAPDLIQLNTLDRPAAYDWVREAGDDALLYVKSFLAEFKVQVVREL